MKQAPIARTDRIRPATRPARPLAAPGPARRRSRAGPTGSAP